MIRFGTTLSLLVSLAIVSEAAVSVSVPPRPNVVLILADDLGFSDLGCQGGEIATPNLDALAAGGVRFTQFYNATRCCPSRASLMTGLYPHQAGVGGMNNDEGVPGYRGFLQPNSVTLAEVLRSAGYQTFLSGKWHLTLGGDRPSPGPLDRGFDEFYGFIKPYGVNCWKEDAFTRLPEGRPRRRYPAGTFFATDAITDYALDFLSQARTTQRPYFLYVAYNAPHFPLHAHPEDIAKYKDIYNKGWDEIRNERYARMTRLGLIDERWPLTPRSAFQGGAGNTRSGVNPAWDRLDADRQADLARRMAIYAAMVDRMDRQIGRIVDDLRRHGELNNTLILFLSDNGACAEWDPIGFDIRSGPDNILHTGADLDRMGGPDTYHSYGSGWANASNTPFRLYKHYTHEGGIATPLIAHWPGGIPARGELRDQVGHIVDIMSTLVELSGATYPERFQGHAITPMEGRSLVPAFANQPLPREYLAWEHEGNRALRAGRWKIVARQGQPWELYDLKSDRTETRDLAGSQPERVERMARLWESWAERCQVRPGPTPRATREAAKPSERVPPGP
jgi:arylsulfatase